MNNEATDMGTQEAGQQTDREREQVCTLVCQCSGIEFSMAVCVCVCVCMCARTRTHVHMVTVEPLTLDSVGTSLCLKALCGHQ